MVDKELGNHEKTSHRAVVLFTASLLAMGVAFALWWTVLGQYEESTDDAYVSGNQVQVLSQISGSVSAIYADETEFVREGDLLVKLDPTDAKLSYEKQKSELANSVRSVVQSMLEVKEIGADIERALAQLHLAKYNINIRQPLVKSGAVSKEEAESAQAAYLSAEAAVRSLTQRKEKASALVNGTTVETHPQVLDAKAKFKEALVNLHRCGIKSPASGVVAMRSVQVGAAIHPGLSLMTVIPLEEMWIYANFREEQLRHLRIGQPVKIEVDLYGSAVEYTGTIEGIGIGTGSVFSLLPPQNATGNWVKVVQRVPVRIALNKEELKEHPLRLGLSTKVKVDTRDRSGALTQTWGKEKAVYNTHIFESQEGDAEEIAKEIIRKNVVPQ